MSHHLSIRLRRMIRDNWRCPISDFLIAWILFLCIPACAADSNSPTGVMTLVNGDTLAGQLWTSPSANLDPVEVIEWLADDFLDPFAVNVDAIKAIRFENRSETVPEGQFILQCVDGDVIAGDIVDWDRETLMIRSQSFGDVSIRTDAIVNLNRLESDGLSLVTFATALDDWKKTDPNSDGWIEEGENLVSIHAGDILNSNFELPIRAVFDLELSWTGVADFVFAIATDPLATGDTSTDGWRLETVQNQLVAVREGKQQANLQLVADLTKRTTIRLIGYLDQSAGELQFFGPARNQIAKIIDRSESPIGGGVRLINRGNSLKLRRLRIASWPGSHSGEASDKEVRISLSDGETISGTIANFDTKSETLTIGGPQNRNKIKLSDLTSADFAREAVSNNRPQAVFRLRGGIQISGNIANVSRDHWTIQDNKYLDHLRIPQDQVRMIAFSTTEEKVKRWNVQIGLLQDDRRIGRLESNGHHHLGQFSESKGVNEGMSNLNWLPVASRRASRLKPELSGRIFYQVDQDVWKRLSRKETIAPTLRQRSGKNFAKLFLEKVDRVEARRARRDQHVVHLRSGDIISCRVESIDESGVYLSTSAEDNTLVTHADVKAIDLATKTPLPNVSKEKRQRLLTLPRLQKTSPPTHLLSSYDGDLLRCRLLRADDKTIVVEVQMEEIQIPRDRVTHIVWLHPNDSRSENFSEDRYRGTVQALWPDGRRMTFAPTRSSGISIYGTSPILGECEVDLSKISRIILGNRIADEAADLIYANWKLSPAMLPLVMQDFEHGAKSADDSPLVGTMAPDILLERIDGGRFELTEYRDQIVVLDFWASWCAPCMKTMPAIHNTISAYDQTKVTLVAINLEERREVASDAMERLDLDMIVALDVDGVTSAAYQANAIPQTVIIDSGGKVASVIVGGGKEAVSKLKTVVDELLNSQ